MKTCLPLRLSTTVQFVDQQDVTCYLDHVFFLRECRKKFRLIGNSIGEVYYQREYSLVNCKKINFLTHHGLGNALHLSAAVKVYHRQDNNVSIITDCQIMSLLLRISMVSHQPGKKVV